jgi:hypothetical protein
LWFGARPEPQNGGQLDSQSPIWQRLAVEITGEQDMVDNRAMHSRKAHPTAERNALYRLVKKGAIASLTALSLVGLVGCTPQVSVITLTQVSGADVELTELDLNPSGDSGDVTTFEAPVAKDGQPYGSFMGTMTKVGSIGAGWNIEREERMLTAIFDLPEGQISVLGISYYKKSDRLLETGAPETRAIVGGTGKYVGVDGEVTTVRNENGSYTHTLRIH